MSILEQAQLLQRKLQIDLPLDQLENLSAQEFLQSQLQGINVVDEAKEILGGITLYQNEIENQLQELVKRDFEQLLKVPGLLQELHTNLNPLNQQLEKVSKRVATYKTNLHNFLQGNQISQYNALAEKEKQLERQLMSEQSIIKLEQHLKSVQNNVPNALLERMTVLCSKIQYNEKYVSTLIEILVNILRQNEYKLTDRQTNCFVRCFQNIGQIDTLTQQIRDNLIKPWLDTQLKQQDLQFTMKLLQQQIESGDFLFLLNQNLIVDVIFKGIIQCLENKPNIFSPAFKNQYLQNCLSLISFLDWLQQKSSVNCLHLIQQFMDTWNLPTYFQFRQKEIFSLCSQLYTKKTFKDFLQQQPGDIILETLRYCWKDLLLPLAPRFLRASLMIVQQYINYTCRQIENQQIQMEDIIKLIQESYKIYQYSNELVDQVPFIGQNLQNEIKSMLLTVINPCNTSLENQLAQQCIQNLQYLKSIPSAYRMTNRPIPTEPSTALKEVLAPLKVIPDQAQQLIEMVIQQVVQKYLEIAIEVQKAIEKQSDILSKYQGNNTQQDAQKMLIQLRIDTEEFKQMIGELGGNTTLLSDLIDSL